MHKISPLLILFIALCGSPWAMACSWAPPEKDKVISELLTVAAASLASDSGKQNIQLEAIESSYVISEATSTGMCPDAVQFSIQLAFLYRSTHNPDVICRGLVSVVKNIPWEEQPEITYSIQPISKTRCQN